MPDTVSLGTIGASAGLDLRPLQTAVKEAAKMLSGLADTMKGIGDLKFAGPVLDQLESIGDTARIVKDDLRGLRGALQGLSKDLGLTKISEGITRIGVNAVEASGGLEDLSQGLKLAGDAGKGAGDAFVGVKDTLREIRDAARGGATSFGSLATKMGTAGEAGTGAAGGIGAAGDAAELAGGAAEAAAGGFGALKAELGGVAGAGNRAAIALERATKAGKAGVGLGAASAAESAAIGGRRPRVVPVPHVSSAPRAAAGGMIASLGMPMLKGAGVLAEIMAAAGLGSAAYSSSFDVKAQKVMGNTTLTAAQRDGIRKSVLAQMKAGSPVPEDQLFAGYMHAANYGYTGKRADHLMGIASSLGIATGAPVDVQAEVLAGLANKNAFNIPDSKLMPFAESTHVTAAGSAMTLEEFSKRSAKSMGYAARFGIKPEEAKAAFSTMVQSKLPPAQVDTQLSGILNALAAPTPKTVKAAMGIQARTGVDLLPYMGVKGLKNNQISGFLKALQSPGITEQDVVNLFPNKQGRLGASALFQNYGTFGDKLNGPQGTGTAMRGQVHNINSLRRDMMQQPGMAAQSEIQKTKALAVVDGKGLQKDLADIIHLLGQAARAALNAATAFSALPTPIRKMIEAVGLVGLAGRVLGAPEISLRGKALGADVGARGGLLPGFKGMFGKGMFGGAAAAGAEGAGLAEGGAAAGAGAGLAAIAAPLAIVTAAVVTFGIAWHTNFAGIQQAFKPFLDDVRQTFGGMGKTIGEFVTSALPVVRSFGKAVVPIFAFAFWEIGATCKAAFDIIKGVVKIGLAFIEGAFKIGLALLKGDWAGAWTAIKETFSKQWAAIMQAARAVVPELVAWVEGLGTQLKAGFSRLGPDLKAGWDSAVAGLKATFADSGRNLISQFGAGLKNGLASIGPGIRAAAHGLGSLLPEGVRVAIDSHSPSRVMHKIGQDGGQGFINGILSKKGAVSTAAKMIAEAANLGVVIKEPGAKKAHKTEAQRASEKAARHAHSEAVKHGHQVHAAGEYAGGVGETAQQKATHKLGEMHAQGLIGKQQYDAAMERLQAQHHAKAEKAEDGHLKRMQGLHQQFKAFLTGLASSEASAKGRDAKATKSQNLTKAPDALAEARDARLGAAGDAFDQALGKNSAFEKSGQFAPAQIEAASRAAVDAYVAECQAAQDEYEAAVKGQAAKATQSVDALQTEIAKATAHAAGHVWKDGEAQAREYFDGLRAAALDSFNQVEDRINAMPGVSEKQKDALHAGNQGTYNASVADLGMQEGDAAAKRKMDSLRTAHDQAQETFGQDDNRQSYANSLGGILGQIPQDASPEAERMRHEVQTQIDKLGKDGKSTVSELGKNVADSFGNAFEQAMGHAKKFKGFWQEMMQGLKGSAQQGMLGFVTKELKAGVLSLFTRKEKGVMPNFGGAASVGGFNGGSLAALSGLPAGNLLNTGMGGFGQLQGINGAIGGFGGFGSSQGGAGGMMGGLSSLLPMLGHGGMLGGVLGHGGLAGLFAHGGLMTGGGALGGLGAALPWVGGGLLLNKLLGNPVGKMFKKLHLFSGGGIVPGVGFHDSVHALLKPGEVVSNHEQQKTQANGLHITVNHHGDVYGHEGKQSAASDMAWLIKQQLPVATPGT